MVDYDDEAPWPTEPDDTGPTLELIHPDFNNELPENWKLLLMILVHLVKLNSTVQNKIVA